MITIDQLSTQEIMARTAYGENRGGGARGVQSVLNVIVNRATHPTWWGKSYRDVCLKPNQFDCWNPDDPNYEIIMNVKESDAVYASALEMASAAVPGLLPDITRGATYYYAKTTESPPYWARGRTPCANIEGQLFFNDI